jgi:hypothetical protein
MARRLEILRLEGTKTKHSLFARNPSIGRSNHGIQ